MPRPTYVVVIDDLRTFDAFDAVYARSSAAGLAVLAAAHAEGRRVDELWLDHDLGVDAAGRVDDIGPVVDWLCERCVWDDRPDIGRIVVHTSNPAGARMLLVTLGRLYPTVRVDAGAFGAQVP